MALFLHHAGSDGELVTSFHIRQGDRAAGLEWTLRDGSEREILVFQSTEGVVGDGVDPTIDHRQRVVYQGSGLAARVDDDLSDDVAYSYRDDIRYHYSVFARGDDGDWYLQLAATVAPRSVRSWQCRGRQGDDETPADTWRRDGRRQPPRKMDGGVFGPDPARSSTGCSAQKLTARPTAIGGATSSMPPSRRPRRAQPPTRCRKRSRRSLGQRAQYAGFWAMMRSKHKLHVGHLIPRPLTRDTTLVPRLSRLLPSIMIPAASLSGRASATRQSTASSL